MKQPEPVRLVEGQIAASGEVLARAFADDPFFAHALSDPVERGRLMAPLMPACTRYGLLFGEAQPRHALPAYREGTGGAGATHHRGYDVPRDGHALLARAVGGRAARSSIGSRMPVKVS